MPPRRSTSPNLPENRQASGSRGYRGRKDDDREYSRDHRDKESRPYGRADRGRGRGRDAEAESFRERQGGDRYRDRRDRDDGNGRGHYSRSRDDRPSERRGREGSSERNGRGGPSAHRRSASPRPSRPHSSRPRSRSRSHSHSAAPEDKEKERDKAKPNFGASGLLAAATNTVKKTDGTSTLLKYNEPPEARKPVVGWRLYVFKGSEQVGAFWLRCLPAVSLLILADPPAAEMIEYRAIGMYRPPPYTPTECVPHWKRQGGGGHHDRPPFLLETARRDTV